MSVRIEEGKTRFGAPHADTWVTWEVTRKLSPDIWECAVVDEAYNGAKEIFSGDFIRQQVESEPARRRGAVVADGYWSMQPLGSTLHYHYAFGRYVRGEVVEREYDGALRHVLLPKALVGAWEDLDLPRWTDAGVFREGCSLVRMIAGGEVFQPHQSCIWESGEFSKRDRGEDPTCMEPVDLSPPEPTPAQAAAARALGFVTRAKAALEVEYASVTDFEAAWTQALERAAEVIDEARAELGLDRPGGPRP